MAYPPQNINVAQIGGQAPFVPSPADDSVDQGSTFSGGDLNAILQVLLNIQVELTLLNNYTIPQMAPNPRLVDLDDERASLRQELDWH